MSAANSHLLTFDVEHWYEGYRHRNLGGWEGAAPRDHLIVEKLISLLTQYGHHATFFFTGRFAREFPALVGLCVDSGHEVASHSDEHRVIHRMATQSDFRDDLVRSLETLTDLIEKPVKGYRAPKWSIDSRNQSWVLCELADAGLLYDSSFFPAFGGDEARRAGKPLRVELPGGRAIIEIPATGFNLGPVTMPVAGGLYFRAFPGWVASAMLNQKARQRASGMLYVHPYDLDVCAPRIAGGGVLFRLFRSYGVAGAWNKLELLLGKYRFTSIEKLLPNLVIESTVDLRTSHE